MTSIARTGEPRVRLFKIYYKPPMLINTVRNCLNKDDFIYTRHSLDEMAKEELSRIFEEDIEYSIMTGEIISKIPTTNLIPVV